MLQSSFMILAHVFLTISGRFCMKLIFSTCQIHMPPLTSENSHFLRSGPQEATLVMPSSTCSGLGASPEVWTLPDAVRQRPYFWRTRHPPHNSVGSLALVLSWLHSRRIPWEAVGTGHPTDRLVQTGNRADEFYTPRVLPSYFSLEIRKHVAIYATSGHLWCSIFEAALNVSALLFYLAFISLKARRIK